MSAKRIYTYEAMFLISQAVAADFGPAIQHIKEILARGHAEIIALKKWDDRRLAYEIRGQKRGIYILAYFSAPGGDISHIERDCNLSERVLRAMILRADHISLEEMQGADGRKELDIEAKMRLDKPAEGSAQASTPANAPASAPAKAPADAPATAAATAPVSAPVSA